MRASRRRASTTDPPLPRDHLGAKTHRHRPPIRRDGDIGGPAFASVPTPPILPPTIGQDCPPASAASAQTPQLIKEDIYRLCYVRGPEGIIVGLAEQLS